MIVGALLSRTTLRDALALARAARDRYVRLLKAFARVELLILDGLGAGCADSAAGPRPGSKSSTIVTARGSTIVTQSISPSIMARVIVRSDNRRWPSSTASVTPRTASRLRRQTCATTVQNPAMSMEQLLSVVGRSFCLWCAGEAPIAIEEPAAVKDAGAPLNAVARRRAILDRHCARRHEARAGRGGRMVPIEPKDGPRAGVDNGGLA